MRENNYTRFIRAFQTKQSEKTSTLQVVDLILTLKKYWQLEHIGIVSTKQQLTPDKQIAWEKISESRICDMKWYQEAVPWKEERPLLVSNRPLADRRLQKSQSKKIAVAYQQVINKYVQKN